MLARGASDEQLGQMVALPLTIRPGQKVFLVHPRPAFLQEYTISLLSERTYSFFLSPGYPRARLVWSLEIQFRRFSGIAYAALTGLEFDKGSELTRQFC